MGLLLTNEKIWRLPWKHANSLFIQHPIFVQKSGFVDIYPKLQEYIGVTNPVSVGGGIIGPWTTCTHNFYYAYK